MSYSPRGPMNPTEYRMALDRLGLSQSQAAELLGVDPRTSRRYALGERSIPPPTAVLLRLCVSRPELTQVVATLSREEADAPPC